MKERPIIFNTEMVRAILDGRKTQTRRVIKKDIVTKNAIASIIRGGELGFTNCPYGQVGDRLWVRETFRINTIGGVSYKADEGESWIGKWKPSIFMFKKDARIWLEITEVRVERLRNTSLADAIAEGFRTIEELISTVLRLNHLPEDADPWLWVISFRRVE